jgi:hypothetical protein
MIDFTDYWSSLTKDAIDSLIEKSDQISSDLIKMLEQKGLEKSTYEDLTAGWSGIQYVIYRIPSELNYIDAFDLKHYNEITNRTQSFGFEVCFRYNLDPNTTIKSNLNDISIDIFFIEKYLHSYIEKGFWKDVEKSIDAASIKSCSIIPFRNLDFMEYLGQKHFTGYDGPYNSVLFFEAKVQAITLKQLYSDLTTKELVLSHRQNEIIEIIHQMILTVNSFV